MMNEWAAFFCFSVGIFGVPLFCCIAFSEPTSRGAWAALASCIAVFCIPYAPYWELIR